MENQILLEIIGYVASIIIAFSLLMKSLIRLRVLNAIGALVFVIYGILIEAYPVAILNGIIVIIDVYYLIKMIKRSDYFTLMEVKPDSIYLNNFLNFHLKDIKNFFPNFSYQPGERDLVFFVLRNTIPAGLVILRQQKNKAEVLLDYALKDFRDLKIGGFIFDDNANILLDQGIEYLETSSNIPNHTRYLHKMGFSQQDADRFVKEITPHFIRDKNL